MTLLSDTPARREVAPGAFHVPGALSLERQRALIAQSLRLMEGAVPAYVPVVRGGGRMRVRMLCLGRHWNGLAYRYEPVRTDYDQLPVPPLPPEFQSLAREMADCVGMTIEPDICIINSYDRAGGMGLHQDKDEGPASLAAGIPVVSVSLGDAADFLFGGLRRRDPVMPLVLESGDVFVFGGPARLCYHGVSRILPGTAPSSLGLSGRLNLTFRQF